MGHQRRAGHHGGRTGPLAKHGLLPHDVTATVSSDIIPPENPPRFNYAEPVSITTAGELETIFRAYRGHAGYLQKQENNHSGTNEEARSGKLVPAGIAGRGFRDAS
jgi:hypothetical protein